jgi:hypothetical protein
MSEFVKQLQTKLADSGQPFKFNQSSYPIASEEVVDIYGIKFASIGDVLVLEDWFLSTLKRGEEVFKGYVEYFSAIRESFSRAFPEVSVEDREKIFSGDYDRANDPTFLAWAETEEVSELTKTYDKLSNDEQVKIENELRVKLFLTTRATNLEEYDAGAIPKTKFQEKVLEFISREISGKAADVSSKKTEQ